MNLDKLISRSFPPLEHAYSTKDTILYALGVGVGADPLDTNELPFVYEKDLRIIPSQASVIAYPGPWVMDSALGIDWVKLLHGEQGIVFERPLQATATVRGEYQVLSVDDKGPGKGAVILFEKRILDAKDGGVICRVRSTYFLRGDGGCGSWGKPVAVPAALPERAPDRVVDLPTLPRQALIYRLNGDYNPVHIDPEVAARAGFAKPILHGLCTFGIACFSLVQQLCAGDAQRLSEIFVRFSRPVYPGDTIRLELFEEDGAWRFRARTKERDEVVLDRGLARVCADGIGYEPRALQARPATLLRDGTLTWC
jgi:acyl dehydratase